MKRRWLVYGCLAFSVVACGPPWKLMPAPETVSESTYRVELPAGWMRSTQSKEVLFITCDGPALEGIDIRAAGHDAIFKKIDKTSTPDILPSELAELTLALVKNERASNQVVLLENRPVQIAGRQGFRLHFQFETSKGLHYQGVVTGFATADQVYLIEYYGTSLHYFPVNLPVYEQLLESFQAAGS